MCVAAKHAAQCASLIGALLYADYSRCSNTVPDKLNKTNSLLHRKLKNGGNRDIAHADIVVFFKVRYTH